MRFLIKFPTRGRPEKFKKCLKNIQDTIGKVNYRFLITLDDDDETMQTPEIKEILSKHEHYYGKRCNKIEAVNRDMIRAGRDWDILVQTSDDMWFVKQNWGERIIELHGKHFKDLDCYFHFNDDSIIEKINTMQIMGRTYFERTGNIYKPIYKTIYADGHATFEAMLLNKYVYIEDKIFDHRHPANGYKNSDQLYDENNQGAGDDMRIYEEQRNKNFYVTHPEVIPACLLPFQPK